MITLCMARLSLRAGTIAVSLGLLAACGVAPAPAPSDQGAASGSAAAESVSASSSAMAPVTTVGEVEPAPGSTSTVYRPNPESVVVAVEAGHGGCLDWGVADPQQRGQDFAEKAVTLGIAEQLRDALEAEGVSVVMVREDDQALAGDDYERLGCSGPAFRDVNGDGLAGFGPDFPEGTRTRDELQARLDLANVARADLLVSIHVDSIADAGGTLLPIARTETFYADETAWGAAATARLAEAVQAGVVDQLGAIAQYDRQDRGTNAHNLYIVAPPLLDSTPERPDPLRQPTRGALMPAILVEVGSITLPAEHELLLAVEGQQAAAAGIVDGISAFLAERELAARLEPADTAPGQRPVARAGDGPPFWIPTLDDAGSSLVTTPIRVTNTGTDAW